MEPVPIGVAGDLYIGGVQVGARVSEPPGADRGAVRGQPVRRAATGCTGPAIVARYLPDGNIEYLGRSDFQVKIRGFRIELGEIEARLAAYPGVREAVVVALDDARGREAAGGLFHRRDCRRSPPRRCASTCCRLLPDYMVPAAYVPLTRCRSRPTASSIARRCPRRTATRTRRARTRRRPARSRQRWRAIWRELLGRRARRPQRQLLRARRPLALGRCECYHGCAAQGSTLISRRCLPPLHCRA